MDSFKSTEIFSENPPDHSQVNSLFPQHIPDDLLNIVELSFDPLLLILYPDKLTDSLYSIANISFINLFKFESKEVFFTKEQILLQQGFRKLLATLFPQNEIEPFLKFYFNDEVNFFQSLANIGDKLVWIDIRKKKIELYGIKCMAFSFIQTKEVSLEENLPDLPDRLKTLLLQNTTEAIITSDINYIVTGWNHTAERMFGYKPEEVIGQKVDSFLNLEFVENPSVEVFEKLEKIGSWSGITRKTHKDGRRMYLNTSISRVTSPDGQIIGYIGVNFDITEKKLIEIELVRQKELFWLVLDSSPNFIFVKDSDGKIVLSNSNFSTYYQLSDNQSEGKSGSFIHTDTDELNQFEEIDRRVVQNLEQIEVIEKNTRFDGKQFWFSTIKKPLILPDGTVQILGVATDITEKKLSEEKILKQSIFTQQVLNAVPNLIYVKDRDGKIEMSNTAFDSFLEYLGPWIIRSYTTNQREPVEFVHGFPDLFDDERLLTRLAFSENISYDMEYDEEVLLYTSPISTPHWFKVVKTLVPQPEGGWRLLCVADEITDSVSSRKSLELQTAELSAIFDALPDLYIRLSPYNNCKAIFSSVELDFFGLLNIEIGSHFSKFLPCEIYTTFDNCIKKTHDVNRLITYEYELNTVSGKQFFEARFIPFLHTETVIIIRNITQRKDHENKLTEQRALYQVVVEDQTDLISRFTPQGNIRFVNQAFLKFFGIKNFKLEEQINSYPELKSIFESRELWRKFTIENPVAGFHHSFTTFLGETRWLDWTVRAIYDSSGEITQYQYVGRDITEQKIAQMATLEAKEAAEAAAIAKSEFIAMISHEIRTPMVGVMGMTSLLLNSNPSREQIEYIEMIRIGGQNLLKIINEILDLSKLEWSKMEIEQAPFDLAEAIEDIQDLLSTRAAERKNQLIYHIEPDVPVNLIGDVTRLRQVLVNLVGNALKFTEAGHVIIRVRNHCPDSLEFTIPKSPDAETWINIQFEVTDTGIGIPQELQSKVFEAFSQSDSSTTRKFGGTGLGLAIARKLVNLMDGDINVQSEEGKGATFTFYVRLKVDMISIIKPLTNSEKSNLYFPAPILSNPDDQPIIWWLHRNCTVHHVVLEWLKQWNFKIQEFIFPQLDTIEKFWLQYPEPDFIIVSDSLFENEEYRVVIVEDLISHFQGIQWGMILKNRSNIQNFRDGIVPRFYFTKPLKFREIADTLNQIFNGTFKKDSVKIFNTDLIDSTLALQYPLRILVAEDNLVNQKLIERLLEKMGYKPDFVSNGIEAVNSALNGIQYDLIFMDVQMPEMDGILATKNIRNLGSLFIQPIIIAMTANAMGQQKNECLEAGMDDFISKPYKIDQLSQILRKYGKK